MLDKIAAADIYMESLSIYRKILDNGAVKKLKDMLDYLCSDNVDIKRAVGLYGQFYLNFAATKTKSLEEYIIGEAISDENPFTIRGEYIQEASEDIKRLKCISKLQSEDIKVFLLKNFSEYSAVIEKLPEWKCEMSQGFDENIYPEHIKVLFEAFINEDNWENRTEILLDFHRNYGTGIFARYRAFVWEKINDDGQIRGIESPDPIKLSQMVGYETERSMVIENTMHFIEGCSANNVLLYGDRGTGKSSTVKAILNEYYTRGLRMIEVPKANLRDFPEVIREIKERPQRFIIFVDDLVFGDDEESYTALKAVLEGGLECKTSNIVIYATSNRRHLIKEYFSERAGMLSDDPGEEVRAHDSREEKLSLSDRFGISVVFSSPDQSKYLEIVDGLADQRGIKADKETLHKEALKWALWYNGRSARTANQFIDWMEGKEKIISR